MTPKSYHVLRGIVAIVACSIPCIFLGVIDVPYHRPMIASIVWFVCTAALAMCCAIICDRAFHNEWIYE